MGVENRRKSSAIELDVNKMDRLGRFYWVLIGFLVAIIIVLLVLLVGSLDNKQNPIEEEQTPHTQVTQPSEKILTVKSVEEQGNMIVVYTNYCQIKYPYAFADLINVEAINSNEKTSLLFTVLLDGKKMNIYELTFGGEGSISVGEITLIPGQAPVNVYATFYESGTDLNEDMRIAFFAAQETFNDVAASLGENMNFVPAT
jgi:hypothetical protein